MRDRLRGQGFLRSIRTSHVAFRRRSIVRIKSRLPAAGKFAIATGSFFPKLIPLLILRIILCRRVGWSAALGGRAAVAGNAGHPYDACRRIFG